MPVDLAEWENMFFLERKRSKKTKELCYKTNLKNTGCESET